MNLSSSVTGRDKNPFSSMISMADFTVSFKPRVVSLFTGVKRERIRLIFPP